ncbi:MAG: discoidin domain-containing protein, partial [Actinomycetota bacterium]
DRLDGRDGGESDHLVGGPGIDAGTIDGTIDRTRGVERPRVDANLAAWRPTTASNYEPTNPPVRAVDGQTSDWWNSGNYPGQWLEVDLGRPRQIARVSLITMEYPGGSSILLLGRATSEDTFHLLHAFRGPMADLQQVAFAPKKAWRNVRYLRLYIPQVYAPVGWVAWHEMSVYGPKPRAPKRGG